MNHAPKPPLSVRLARGMTRAVSWVVPPRFRADWRAEWEAELYHRWRFYDDAGVWNGSEARRLLQNALGALPDAAWHVAEEESVQKGIRTVRQTPWTPLAVLLLMAALLPFVFGGLPATRQLVRALFSRDVDQLAVISLHSSGSRDRGLPQTVLNDWLKGTRALAAGAPFKVRFHPDGDYAFVATNEHFRAVTDRSYELLSLTDNGYRVAKQLGGGRTYLLVRMRHPELAVSLKRELSKAAIAAGYQFFGSELRVTPLGRTLTTPLRFFLLSATLSALLICTLCRVRMMGRVRWRPTAFLATKMFLCFTVVFIAGLEICRGHTSILLGWADGGSGPSILWLYIIGTMASLFWCLADQRSRCRICLRQLCSPIRIGSPGCLLLDWAGTELLCTEGHGVLHIPHLSLSWDQELEHWITLDDSWQGIFTTVR